MFRSLQNRERKLAEALRDLESGLLSQAEWEARQRTLPDEDVRDQKTADEEEVIEGLEESECQDEEIGAATDALTAEELRAEISEVRELVRLAREVYNLRRESKFEKLWEALEAYPDTVRLSSRRSQSPHLHRVPGHPGVPAETPGGQGADGQGGPHPRRHELPGSATHCLHRPGVGGSGHGYGQDSGICVAENCLTNSTKCGTI